MDRRRKQFILPILLGWSAVNGCTDANPTLVDVGENPDQANQTVIDQWLTIDLAGPLAYAEIEYPQHYDEQVLALDNTPTSNPVTDEGATLGRVLFHDPDLSLNRTTSCASCHRQDHGFGDPSRFSAGLEGELTLAHSMRLANVAFYEGHDMFWDRRAMDVESQVLEPVTDGTEMGFTPDAGGIEALIDRLESTPYYPILFEWAFGSSDLTEARIRAALAQYVRSIVSVDSRFDEGAAAAPDLGSPFTNFSTEENLGKDLFMRSPGQGGGGCARCHIPPTFALDGESGSIGLDPDESTVFKSPSLKNVAVGSPFMHDGRFGTLEEVVEHYDNGIQAGPALDRRLETAPGVPLVLGLSATEKAALVAFLRTLTDTEMQEDERFSDPFRD